MSIESHNKIAKEICKDCSFISDGLNKRVVCGFNRDYGECAHWEIEIAKLQANIIANAIKESLK